MTASLDQGSGSTKLSIELSGVPVGKEDETQQGIEVYYIRSLKVSLSLTAPLQMHRPSALTDPFAPIQQIGLVIASPPSALNASRKAAIAKVPHHPWQLPNFHSSTAHLSTLEAARYYAAASVSVLGSILFPVALIGLFGWLLYRGPTFAS